MRKQYGIFRSSPLRIRGITLIELVIVIAIIAVLSSVAYPLYQNQIQRARRADGKASLMDAAQRMERCYSRLGRYDHPNCDVTLPFDSPETFYSVSAVGDINRATFTLAATPQNLQVHDEECGVLRLSSRGEQGSQDQDTDVNDCW